MDKKGRDSIVFMMDANKHIRNDNINKLCKKFGRTKTVAPLNRGEISATYEVSENQLIQC